MVNLLRNNLDLFAWQPSDMLGIDPSIVCQNLAVNPGLSQWFRENKNWAKKGGKQ